MSKLAKLLEAKEPVFSLALRDLEKLTGKKSIDVHLLTEIEHKAHQCMRRLELDPLDTTPRELYKALENRIAEDNKRLTKIIGGTSETNMRKLTPLMIKAAKEANIPKRCWVLKRSVARQLLRKMPPEKMMKHLGYRTIDSMLKRESLDEIYSALRFSEGGDWLREYNTVFKHVQASDFEERDISILEMDYDKWVDLAEPFIKKRPHNVTHTKEFGTIVVIPIRQTQMQGIALKVLPLIFHYINEIRLYSSFFKYKAMRKNFGEEVVDTLIAEPSKVAVVAGQHIHWRVIQRYFAKVSDEQHPEAFEPHVHPEDLHWRRAEEILYDLDPAMEFWRNLDFVMVDYKEGPVSLALTDVAFAYSNEKTFAHRYTYHARESLWNEIFMRYMGERALEREILEQLDNDLIAPEQLMELAA